MSLNEFLLQYEKWLWQRCHCYFRTYKGLSEAHDVQDIFQECFVMLPDILNSWNSYISKPCAITTFVNNRLRGRFQSKLETELRYLLAELETKQTLPTNTLGDFYLIDEEW